MQVISQNIRILAFKASLKLTSSPTGFRMHCLEDYKDSGVQTNLKEMTNLKIERNKIYY